MKLSMAGPKQSPASTFDRILHKKIGPQTKYLVTDRVEHHRFSPAKIHLFWSKPKLRYPNLLKCHYRWLAQNSHRPQHLTAYYTRKSARKQNTWSLTELSIIAF